MEMAQEMEHGKEMLSSGWSWNATQLPDCTQFFKTSVKKTVETANQLSAAKI